MRNSEKAANKISDMEKIMNVLILGINFNKNIANLFKIGVLFF